MARGRLGDPVANRTGARERVVDLVRVFPVSRERLYRAWTDPVEFARWWGPKGWTATDCVLEARPGGRWGSTFQRPGQAPIRVGGEFREVDAPQRLVFTWDSYGEQRPEDLSIVTLEFVTLGLHTELRLSHRKLTTGEAEDMDVGWVSAFDCLLAYLVEPVTLAALKTSGSPEASMRGEIPDAQ